MSVLGFFRKADEKFSSKLLSIILGGLLFFGSLFILFINPYYFIYGIIDIGIGVPAPVPYLFVMILGWVLMMYFILGSSSSRIDNWSLDKLKLGLKISNVNILFGWITILVTILIVICFLALDPGKNIRERNSKVDSIKHQMDAIELSL